MKKYMILTLCAGMIFSAASLTGCNESAQTAKTTSQSSAVSTVSTEEETEATKPTEAATADEKAVIKEKGLKVDEDGNVVDSNGKTLETTKDGTVKVQADDGSVVEISTATIKKETSAASGSTGSAVDNKTSSAQTKTENKSNSTTSKPAASNSGSSKVNNTSSSTTSKPANQNSSTSSKPAAGSASSGNTSSTTTKKWHEAQYEYIQHPAETKQVWVVDQEAYTYEKPVYEEVERAICNNCEADITDCITAHMKEHALNGTGKYGYRGEWVEMQVGTETVTVPEKGHWETQVVKEAWTEKKLIREAGYY